MHTEDQGGTAVQGEEITLKIERFCLEMFPGWQKLRGPRIESTNKLASHLTDRQSCCEYTEGFLGAPVLLRGS